MIFRLNIFWKELVLFAPALFIGIFSAYNYVPIIEKSILEPPSFSWNGLIIFLMFFVVLMLVMARFKKFNSIALRFFLLLVVFSGSQIVMGSIISSPWDLFYALAITVIFMFAHNVLVHDIGIMLGIAGVSSMLGISIPPETVVFLLVILSFYDIIAVYWTKHMVYLARGMVESGAIFGFIIPFDIKDIFYHKTNAKEQMGEKFMILGSGDVGMPLIMVSSLAVVSIQQALIVGLFSLIGLFITHLLFVNQDGRKPMAALPPIATMTIIGYVITKLL